MEFYILGGYLALLLYAVLLDDVKPFLEYMTALAETFIKANHIKKTHPYSLLQSFGVFLLLTSWVGIIMLLGFVGDFLISKHKNKKNKNKE